MPRGKDFCPFENDFFERAAFSVVDGTLLHLVEPLHRATDGLLVDKEVHIEPVELEPVADADFGIEPVEEEE